MNLSVISHTERLALAVCSGPDSRAVACRGGRRRGGAARAADLGRWV